MIIVIFEPNLTRINEDSTSEHLTVKNLSTDAITAVSITHDGTTAYCSNIDGGFWQICTSTGDFKKIDMKNESVAISLKAIDDYVFLGLDSGVINVYQNGVYTHKLGYKPTDWGRSIDISKQNDEYHILTAEFVWHF